jgi:hypothetical protein
MGPDSTLWSDNHSNISSAITSYWWYMWSPIYHQLLSYCPLWSLCMFISTPGECHLWHPCHPIFKKILCLFLEHPSPQMLMTRWYSPIWPDLVARLVQIVWNRPPTWDTTAVTESTTSKLATCRMCRFNAVRRMWDCSGYFRIATIVYSLRLDHVDWYRL